MTAAPAPPISGGLVPPSHRSRAEALAESLAGRIRTAALRPGERVGSLEELRRSTGLGRATVSAAVGLLRERGVLVIRPGRGGGLFVAQPSPIVRLRHTLLSVGDGVAVADAIEVRESLEELVDLDASRYCTSADGRELDRCLAGMRASIGTPSAFMTANWALHRRIAAIGRNRAAAGVYLAMLDFVVESTAGYTSDDPEWPDYAEDRCRRHEALVAAIVAGDEARVRAAVRRHRAPEA
ncbi:MAG: hypothetical protein BGO95_06190 [Micrococcales bacterium 73-13]|nr:MAG: hypothetical protein BGO95_06190 [Micrococcales bacterium 73-13]